jgi:hypothetical protein
MGRVERGGGDTVKGGSAHSIDRFAGGIHMIRQNISALFEAFPETIEIAD